MAGGAQKGAEEGAVSDLHDPFALSGPALVNVSGGSTSAYMLRRILDANGGKLPEHAHAVFANTGKERPETLAFLRECSERWGVPITWIERDTREAGGFREVDFDTASRKGEPFARLIREKNFLPNPVMRFCTADLKIKPARDFMRAQGYDHWTSVVGLRYDEPGRVHKLRARDHGEWDVACPLYDARVTKPHVTGYFRRQPFRLALRHWEGNCDGCFLKGAHALERIERDRPGTLAWWDEQEERVGATFVKGRRYLHVIQRATLQTALPGILTADPDEDSALPCACTDRRLPRRRCTCGAVRGHGHALSCARVMGEPDRSDRTYRGAA